MAIDTIIRGGRIIDGCGNPWRYGDVLIEGDRILDIVPPGSVRAEGAEVVDATGMFVCPGFIDIQSHSIVSLMRDGRCVSKITQGITTEIMGEVWTPAPAGGLFPDPFAPDFAKEGPQEWHERARGWKRFGDWLRAMEANGVSPNVGSFLSGGTLRCYAMGMDGGKASPEQLAVMERVMTEAMEDGAFGPSYALIYPPDTYATTEEIIAVCCVAAKYHGLYITHMRSESMKLLEGLDEALRIGREAGIPVEIYHLKASGKPAWGLMDKAIERIQNARDSGQDVTADMYPYQATGTRLSSILPTWIFEGGNMLRKIVDPVVRERLRRDVEDPNGPYDGQFRSAGLKNILPIGFRRPENKIYEGRRLDEIVAMRGQDWLDTVCDLLISEQRQIYAMFFKMSEDNIRRQLQLPWVTVSTDAAGVDPEWARSNGPTHPRGYGTYPRVLGHYVRELRLLTWEEAVRKMTSAVADRLRLRDRGRLLPRQFADVVVFDPETVIDNATFEDTHQLSTGILHVWVNGTRVVKDGTHTGKTPGRFVKPASLVC